MKGLVFTEFMDMVETTYGLDMQEYLLEQTQPASGGAYTAVGTYDHQELVSMLACLSSTTGEPLRKLLYGFGVYLFARFSELHPRFFERPGSAFEFLSTVEHTVHQEVRKLYPEAELPSFDFAREDSDKVTLTYRSCRPFGDLAEGLIAGCSNYYGETIRISKEDLSKENQTHIRFNLLRQSS